MEKALKVREPLAKRQAEDPGVLDKLRDEVAELTQQLAALGTGTGTGTGGEGQQQANGERATTQ